MSSQKRIIRELTKTYPEYMQLYNIDYSLVIINEDSENKINQIGLVSPKNELKLVINLSKEYPFKPPSLQLEVNNTSLSYTKWLSKIIDKNTNDELLLAYIFTIINIPISRKYFKHIPHSKECLCCSSLTCSATWSPKINIFDLTIEYLSRKKLELFLKPLMQKYLSKIFENDKWVLNEDLIFYILDFVIQDSVFTGNNL